MPLEIDFVAAYDREALIQELRRIAGALGKATLSRREIDSYGRISSTLVIKRFGSLRKARFMKATDKNCVQCEFEAARTESPLDQLFAAGIEMELQ